MKVAALATIEDRKEQVQKTIKSLLPQVDKVCVFLNYFDSDFADKLKKMGDVEVLMGTNELYGDARKFQWVDRDFGFYFPCDDDIIYKEGYIDYLIEGLKEHDVVSLHGRQIELPVKNYYSPKHKKVAHCRFPSKGGRCNFLGTGVMGFHTSKVDIKMSDFKDKNMADVWAGIKFKDLDTYCLPHNGDLVKVQKVGKTIFNQAKNGAKQAQYINRYMRSNV